MTAMYDLSNASQNYKYIFNSLYYNKKKNLNIELQNSVKNVFTDIKKIIILLDSIFVYKILNYQWFLNTRGIQENKNDISTTHYAD